MSTITQEQADKITAYLASHTLPVGLGSEESACSIAAINLALAGKMTDKTPACMSLVIGRWIIPIQDAMPDDMRNSLEWKRLLPLAAGTGRDLEPQRKAVAMEWMWTVVLTQLQPLADKHGYGDAWLRMTTEKTQEAAIGAKKAASASASASAYASADAYASAYAVAYASTYAVAYAAAAAVAYAAASAARKKFWVAVDPCKCLADMIAVSA